MTTKPLWLIVLKSETQFTIGYAYSTFEAAKAVLDDFQREQGGAQCSIQSMIIVETELKDENCEL